MSRARAEAALLAGAFAALAALVAAGTFTGLDQWSVDHLMPGAHFGSQEPSALQSLVPLLTAKWDKGTSIATNVVTLPASFLLALAIAAWRSRLLALALLAAVAVEAVCKELLVRPALYAGAHGIPAFDSSFPSGHALRTVVIAGALLPLARGRVARAVLVAWAVASLVLLELGGWHTPSDVAGGALLGLSAFVFARGARALRARRLARA